MDSDDDIDNFPSENSENETDSEPDEPYLFPDQDPDDNQPLVSQFYTTSPAWKEQQNSLL